jgi:hypothetical protein
MLTSCKRALAGRADQPSADARGVYQSGALANVDFGDDGVAEGYRALIARPESHGW